MKIKYKLIALVVIALVSLSLFAGISVKDSREDAESLRSIRDHSIENIEALLHLRANVNDLVRRGYEMNSKQSYDDVNFLHSEIKRIRALKTEAETGIQDAITRFEASGISPAVQPEWNKFKTIFEPWLAVWVPEINAHIDAVANKPNPTRAELDAMLFKIEALMTGEIKQNDQVRNEIIQLVALNNQEVTQSVHDSLTSSEQATKFQVILSIVAMLGLTGLGWATVRAITQPLNRVRDVVQQVGRDRNFLLRINHNSKDEIGEVTQAFDGMLDDLQAAFRDIQERNEKVNQAVASMASSAQQVAASSSSQSSSTSAVAAAVEEMTVSINTVTGSASEAQTMAHQAGEVSTEGAKIISQTSDEMGSIAKIVEQAAQVIRALGTESEQISSVVQVIKEVADQTNLLALNAAIEAARAGDQGRGFAVVADEVRKLAERTAQSTSDISTMVSKIQLSSQQAVGEMERVVKQVESGQELAQEAGLRIHSILDEANKVSEAVTEISSALKEQSQASHEIARHVESIAQITDENHAAAKESASGAQDLNQLAQEIGGVLAQFKV
jgi:methyl-accepting chemotaxis protein